MKFRVDIEKKSMIAMESEETSDVVLSQQQQYEQRLNKYMKDFMNLNDSYESALDQTRKQLDSQVD